MLYIALTAPCWAKSDDPPRITTLDDRDNGRSENYCHLTTEHAVATPTLDRLRHPRLFTLLAAMKRLFAVLAAMKKITAAGLLINSTAV